MTIGTDDEMAHSSLRFGIGRFSTEAEIDLAINLLEKHVARYRLTLCCALLSLVASIFVTFCTQSFLQ
jgi:cysteine sulfinate desulfinase/cysteine desulfurase-like protein